MSNDLPCSLCLTTPLHPGAIAIVQLHGPAAQDILHQLLPAATLPAIAQLKLVDLPNIDQAVLARLDEQTWQLMPHGGVRVVQKLMERLIEHGAVPVSEPSAQSLYPEANSPLEAEMMRAMAMAQSPLAVPLLAMQPQRWAMYEANPNAITREKITAQSKVLNHLLRAPSIVIVGPANVGKSTLINAMLGQTVSIVADQPGTTRDWTSGTVTLHGLAKSWQAQLDGTIALEPFDGLTVRWLDTPGLRESEDTVEQRAIVLARQVLKTADLFIAMRDPATDWPSMDQLTRTPDLWVMNKMDDALLAEADALGHTSDTPLPISAQLRKNLDLLQQAIFRKLHLMDVDLNIPWSLGGD